MYVRLCRSDRFRGWFGLSDPRLSAGPGPRLRLSLGCRRVSGKGDSGQSSAPAFKKGVDSLVNTPTFFPSALSSLQIVHSRTLDTTA